MDNTDMQVGRLDGRLSSLEDRFDRFDAKLDQMAGSITQLSLAAAKNSGSDIHGRWVVSTFLTLSLAIGAWFWPVLDRLLRRN